MPFCNPVVSSMLPNVIAFLAEHPLLGTDDASLSVWTSQCEESWADIAKTHFTKQEAAAAASILATMLEAYKSLARMVAIKQASSTVRWSEANRRRTLETLLNLPQIEQRTAQWYADGANLLTASQFHEILKPTRSRGQLVLEKASTAVDTRQRLNVVRTEGLNAFTWGIRFEPLIKMIYEALTDTTITEMGRLRHPTDTRLAASPDGLITKGPPERLGRFVEFKAPCTRVINDTIPPEYMTQMQIQMEVGQVEECDYFEVKFNSAFPGKQPITEPPTTRSKPKFYGNIFLVQSKSTQKLGYIYGPLCALEWMPTLEEDQELLEKIAWWTDTWHLVTVGRSRVWFESVRATMEEFWHDVELAKQGKFTLPAPSRPQKGPVCKIMADPDADQ